MLLVGQIKIIGVCHPSESMRAFVSALLVAALLLPLLVFVSSQAGMRSAEGLLLSKAFAAQANRNAAETSILGVKEIIRQTAAERTPRDARSVKETELEAARRLALFEEFAEKEFGARGKQVDIWCGEFSDVGRKELALAMAREKKAMKCARCWDASSRIVLAGKKKVEVVDACAFAILVEPVLVMGGRAGIGNSALSLLLDESGSVLVPLDAALAEAIVGGEFVIGVSVYDAKTGAASVEYAAQGEMEGY